MITHQRILILDYGSQFTQLIARRVREAGAFCEIHAGDVSAEFIRSQPNLRGIILSGCHGSMTAEEAYPVSEAVFEAGVPVLGIAYGMQAMARHFGARTEPSQGLEAERTQVRAHGHTALLKDIADVTTAEGHGMLNVWLSHGDQVVSLPEGFVLMASSPSCAIAGIANEAKQFYGVQFHPEVSYTTQGAAIVQRFVRDICACSGDWNMPAYVNEAIEAIREQVGSDHVILGLSGGVDSSVAAALIHRAIGDQLTCVFVDHGLLRLNEGQQVMDTFAKHFGMNIIHVDATEQFMGELAGVIDPEAKRKIIGKEFVDIFQREAAKVENAKWLAQGTIYPDVVESAAVKSGKVTGIKSHHNVGGLPDTLNLKLLEPLRELFKDEVRQLGVALGLPHEMVYRHPFPGPGLGVRILGEVTKEYADILRAADAIFMEELRNTIDPETGKNWYELTSQAFTVFIPVKSVGMVNDARTYSYVVSLRAVETSDFMTADCAELPYSMLRRVSNRIITEVEGISRVTYDVSGKPPATIEWE